VGRERTKPFFLLLTSPCTAWDIGKLQNRLKKRNKYKTWQRTTGYCGGKTMLPTAKDIVMDQLFNSA
jgi:hypothetical protein